MPDQPLPPFPVIDLALPALPPRSRLYPLPPIGLGSPEVESLTSYLTRLANAHCVPLTKLAQLEFAPLLDKEGRTALAKFTGSGTKTLNGRGGWAAWTLVALETLTQVEGLRCLTMYPWRNVLSREKLLRPHLAWCPSCYAGWRQAGQPLYNPLLWHLHAVEICPRHERALCHHCPHPDCRRPLPVVNNRGRLGYCPYCHGWLGADEAAQPGNDLNWSWQRWLTGQLGEMFRAAPHLPADPESHAFARNLWASLDTADPNRTAQLASQARMSPSPIYQWLNRITLPRLDLLARVCYHLDRPLLDILTANPDEAGLPIRQTRPTVDIGAVQQRLEPFLNETPPRPAEQVARQLGVSVTVIHRHFPELYRRLVERHEQYRQSQQRHKRDRLQRELQAFLQSEEMPPLPLREVARRLQVKLFTLNGICPEACRSIAQRHSIYHQARRAKAEAGLKQILAAAETPPSVAEAASRLGERPQYLYKYFPDLCHQITRRHYSHRPAPRGKCRLLDHQQIEHRMAAIIAGEEKPLPSLQEVARRLECSCISLRHHHSSLCRQLRDQAQAYHAAQASGLSARLGQILARNESPAPSLREISSRLGVKVYALEKACPDMCAEILRRAQAERQAAKQQRQAFLDQVLARSDGPPPALTQVAITLNTTPRSLRDQFPEEIALIVQRRQAYDAAERQTWRDALQAALAVGPTPPPPLAEVARQLGYGDDKRLRFHFPDLCQQLQERRQAYLADRRHDLQPQLEAILAESQVAPPPTLVQAARQLGCDGSSLKRLFPTQVHAIGTRRRQHDEAKRLAAERALQAVAEDEQGTPPVLADLARELGYTYDGLRINFPDLVAVLGARRRAFVKARSQQRRHQLTEEVKRITRELYQQGINPSTYQLRLHSSKPSVRLSRHALEAWREARAELGLPT